VKIGSWSDSVLEVKRREHKRMDELAMKGDKVTVYGTLIKDTLIGYYLYFAGALLFQSEMQVIPTLLRSAG